MFKGRVDMVLISRIVFIAILVVLIGYLFFGMVNMGGASPEKQAANYKEIIDKALVQCYALEGSYPADIHYLSKYGVLFLDEQFYYSYDIFATNVMPSVVVAPIY